MKKNVIMGVSKGYGWHELEPFINSWKKNASDAELVLFVDDTSDWTKFVVETQGGDENLRLLPITESKFDNRLISELRWEIFADFLEKHRMEYSQVLLTDVRDVIFQGDIFKLYEKYPSYFVYPTEFKIIADEPINTKWIANFFGKEVWQKMKDNKVVCIGTVWGTVNEIILFSRKMDELSARSLAWGTDQAVANYIVHNGLLSHVLPNATIIENDYYNGSVFTCALKRAGITDDKILSPNQKIPTIVHQYDRHPDLVRIVNRQYRSNSLPPLNDFGDLMSLLDASNAAIQRNQYQICFKMLMYLAEKYSEASDWKGAFNRLTKLFRQTAPSKSIPFSVEIIEQTLERVLMLTLNDAEINFEQLDTLYALLNQAKNNHHTIYRRFEQFLGKCIWVSVNVLTKNDYIAEAAAAIERLSTIDYNFNGEFYFTAAELNRRIGNKDKALEYYKKLLEI